MHKFKFGKNKILSILLKCPSLEFNEQAKIKSKLKYRLLAAYPQNRYRQN